MRSYFADLHLEVVSKRHDQLRVQDDSNDGQENCLKLGYGRCGDVISVSDGCHCDEGAPIAVREALKAIGVDIVILAQLSFSDSKTITEDEQTKGKDNRSASQRILLLQALEDKEEVMVNATVMANPQRPRSGKRRKRDNRPYDNEYLD